MSYRFTRRPPTEPVLLALTLGVCLALGSTERFATTWAELVGHCSDRALLVGGLMLLHTLVFWSLAAFFHRVDTTDKPAFIARRRIQQRMRKHPPLDRTLRVLVRNQFVLLPVLLLAVGEVLMLRGWTAEASVPSFGRVLLELVIQSVCALVVFYTTHRFLHRKWWLKRVHRIHHEFRTSTALASEYAHPVEFAVGNFLTLAGGALVFAPHLLSIYLFALLGTLTFVIHHCGYVLPFAPWSLPHDWHHFRVREMFGTVGLIDRLMGTDAEFRTLRHGDER